ncbi:MAG: heavy metal translocating P-type ATPase [Bacilli bacterium]|nr:heavy metal translocating P-type ATPase [Bacilli bacterium]
MNCEEKYDISGMSCAACSARVDKAVRKLEGVNDVNVNLLTNSMVVQYNEELTNKEKIISAVVKAGYGASIHVEKEIKTSEDLKDKETPKLLRRLIASIILLVPLFYLGMGFMLEWPIGVLHDNLLILAAIEMVLSLSIMIINRKFFTSGFKAIIHRAPNMDTLVALGSGVAFLYSFIMTIVLLVRVVSGAEQMVIHMTAMNLYYETAGMVPTLITIGKTLESYSKGKTTNSIKALMDLSPKTAIILKEGEEAEIPINLVQIGDIFIIKPGQSAPVDGEVIEGASSVDESMLTGESMPIEKEVGSIVKSATINQNGVLICKATRVGNDTTLNQIISLVERASNSKAKISQIADKVSGIFVPVVIIISFIVFACWMLFGKHFIDSHPDIQSTLLSYSIERAISILVVSCPCALGLATPVAIMVGSGKGARIGVLFKNAVAIEETGKIDYVVFDKTGTITKGHPEVTEVISNIDEHELLSIAFSLERNSNHPLAKAIVDRATRDNAQSYDVDNFINVSGKGISGTINSQQYHVGNMSFIKELGISLDAYSKKIIELSKEGKTTIIISNDKAIIGLIAISDTVKEDSKEAIEKIKSLGVVPIMLTGDNKLTAEYISRQVGIDQVISDVLPEGKYQVVEELKKQGKVMMVGDGINDAVALTSADIGMAIGQGSDIAIESADVVLMKSSLTEAYSAIQLSRYIYRNIKENLFWAFIYNIIMIPIAAGVLSGIGVYKLAPWMGSAAMALSSLFVVTNSLRINFFNPHKKHIWMSKTKHAPDILKLIIEEEEKENTMEKIIKVGGMMCMHCVGHVKKALEAIDGVESADPDLNTGNVAIKLSKEISDDLLKAAIEEAGYEFIK